MRQEDDFSKGKRGPVIPPDPKKTRITIRLDTKILKWFWQRVDEAGGGNYQTMINDALKNYIESEDKKTIRYPGGPHPELDEKYQSDCEAKGLKFKVRFYDFENKTRELRFDRKKAA
jgi:hypothetical protein